MRLKSIKLAGFKSFVDPTTVNFPSNLAGVVGPNGCGKSNVIDAVRWVMGESSAKQLRGDSMTDVIFNGSNGRKPVGQASIELIFDNSSGRITGEYASYNEISVRRRVTREGQSDYFLNGARCRRRDITDIFLGTGLGPRSYSIIEQGMISNLITAKPEDLRVYIEEAAGISKYKERRRDTENRIRRTRENLERLSDLREELGRQLQRLERQAQAAEKYREYKKEERLLNEQLLSLRWQSLNEELTQRKEKTSRTELEIEKLVVAELACNNEIEKLRAAASEKTDVLNKVQSRYYEIGAEIARLEQTIKHHEERKHQLASDIQQTEQSYQETQSLLKSDEAKLEGWTAELEELARQKSEAEMAAEAAAEELAELELQAAKAQETWDAFQAASADTRQKAEVEQSRIKHFEQSMQAIASRRDRIRSQLGDNQSVSQIDEQLQAFASKQDTLQAQTDQARELEESVIQNITDTRARLNQFSSELDALRTELQQSRGRLSSLQALQEAAISDDQAGAEAWLASNNLGESPRLVDELQVEPGWEVAVETVLGGGLKAIVVPDIDDLFARLSDFSNGEIELVESGGTSAQDNCLAAKVKSKAVHAVLSTVFLAESLDDARKQRSRLSPGESLITREGIWLGTNWCRVCRDEVEGTGVIERKAEIDSLSANVEKLESTEIQLKETIADLLSQLQTLEEKQRQARHDKEAVAAELSRVSNESSALRARHEQLVQQLEHNRSELAAADEQYRHEEALLAESRIALAQALDDMESDSGKRDELLQSREQSRTSLSECRGRHQEKSQAVQQLSAREQLVSTQLESLKETMQRMKGQLEHLAERRQTLQVDTPEGEDPIREIREQLQERLKARLEEEHKLTEAREQLQSVEQAIREQENQRQKCSHDLLNVRERLQEQRISSQDLVTRKTTLEEQLGSTSPEAVVADLPEGASESEWNSRLQSMQDRINRLGPINLAAIDEFNAEQERKTYLDEQNNELVEALETLETAIRKIDRETRTRFKETFDKIDSGFKALFPRLFGGGHAYLELTGDDLLETGVTIMARPPGKRNSTIHLLSGGEKAMTAIALVFAIFQLNPAPFCMLDEVDAPLDDANVGRFASMVKEMSETVQLIFITHNKITMEIADQLMGVTMHEPGVSRLVTVDVESAIKMAAV
ncbi:MAG: chromosome segregation protein SMC [Porticoccaceae bacterium]